ncbi:MAG: YabP/YqfC family sporulation protein [Oscillospiraceae bacterium]
MKNKNHRRSIGEMLGAPADAIKGVPRVSISGFTQVLLENHGGLVGYCRDSVEVRARNGFLRVRGQDLELAAMTKTEIIIRGIIVSVEQG